MHCHRIGAASCRPHPSRIALFALLLCLAPALRAAPHDPEVEGERVAEPQLPSRFTPPRLLERVEAAYPEEARRQGLTGTVLIQLTVGTGGKVDEARVARGAGHGFDESALAAARLLRFEPATLQGAPVATQINYEVHFELKPAEVPTLHDTARATDQSAEVEKTQPAMEAVVEGDRPFSAASARTVRERDFLLRPRVTPEDILRVVPGLVLAQHQGGGKADQLFLRGFDADHGTDVSVKLDGIPVNMPSHAHGQGFADLNFLIPEAIERVDITKGPYFAEEGDFDTAGAVNLVTRRSFDHSQVTLQSGLFPTLSGSRSDGTPRLFSGWRALGVVSPEATSSLTPWFAAEVYGTGGPFIQSEQLQRYNLFGKASYDLSPRVTLSLLLTAYASSWVGSGQIPARLVDSGVIDRYGAIDPTEGGDSQRQQALFSLVAHPGTQSTFTAQASVIRSGLTLFNDFTFQLNDPTHGDEIEQDDSRTSLFLTLRYDRSGRFDLFGERVASFASLGAQLRSDSIDASLWKVQQRSRLASCLSGANPCVSTQTRQTDGALWVQEELRPSRMVRLVLGLRDDLFEFDVHSGRADGTIDQDHPQPLAPTVQRSIVSPKASLVVSPLDTLDLYFNFGSGFHSNDARSVVESGGAGALPRALGYEVGARARLFDDRVDLAAALWRLDLGSELVWSGDDGGTSPSGATRRYGLDLEARWQILSWLYADLDLSLAKSRYQADAGNGQAVALAPPLILTGGLTAQHPSGVKASLRLRHIGERPGSQLTADDPADPAVPGGPRVSRCTVDQDASTSAGARCYLVADGYTLLDGAVSYELPHWTFTLMAENLTNAAYREAQFGNVSQVISAPAGSVGFSPEKHPVQDIHFTPGNPLLVQLAVTHRF